LKAEERGQKEVPDSKKKKKGKGAKFSAISQERKSGGRRGRQFRKTWKQAEQTEWGEYPGRKEGKVQPEIKRLGQWVAARWEVKQEYILADGVNAG